MQLCMHVYLRACARAFAVCDAGSLAGWVAGWQAGAGQVGQAVDGRAGGGAAGSRLAGSWDSRGPVARSHLGSSSPASGIASPAPARTPTAPAPTAMSTTEVKLFGRWAYEDVMVSDLSLTDYIAVDKNAYTFLPHTQGHYGVCPGAGSRRSLEGGYPGLPMAGLGFRRPSVRAARTMDRTHRTPRHGEETPSFPRRATRAKDG